MIMHCYYSIGGTPNSSSVHFEESGYSKSPCKNIKLDKKIVLYYLIFFIIFAFTLLKWNQQIHLPSTSCYLSLLNKAYFIWLSIYWNSDEKNESFITCHCFKIEYEIFGMCYHWKINQQYLILL